MPGAVPVREPRTKRWRRPLQGARPSPKRVLVGSEHVGQSRTPQGEESLPRRQRYIGAVRVSEGVEERNDDQSSVSADALFASISTYRATASRSSSLCGANLKPKV